MLISRENDFEEYERIRERHNYLRRERRMLKQLDISKRGKW